MKYIIESVIAGTGKHYAYYGGYRENSIAHHRWANNKKDAEIYTNERDLHHDLAVLSNDYTALEFKILEIKGE